MGPDSLKNKDLKTRQRECKHEHIEDVWEDSILLGRVYYGRQCTNCYKSFPDLPSPIALGVYV